MKVDSIVNRKRRKLNAKRNINKVINKILVYLIYYPIVLPIEKAAKFTKKKRDVWWMDNEDKLKKAMLNEVVNYVASYVAAADERKSGFQVFLIYNSHENDDTNYGNALHLRSFMEFSFYTRKNKNYKSKLYRDNDKLKHGPEWSSDKFYDGLMKYLEKKLGNIFENETVKIETENGWNRNYEYISIKR